MGGELDCERPDAAETTRNSLILAVLRQRLRLGRESTS
jgi:hypothetical protein